MTSLTSLWLTLNSPIKPLYDLLPLCQRSVLLSRSRDYREKVIGQDCGANMAATEHCNAQTILDEWLWLLHLLR